MKNRLLLERYMNNIWISEFANFLFKNVSTTHRSKQANSMGSLTHGRRFWSLKSLAALHSLRKLQDVDKTPKVTNGATRVQVTSAIFIAATYGRDAFEQYTSIFYVTWGAPVAVILHISRGYVLSFPPYYFPPYRNLPRQTSHRS